MPPEALLQIYFVLAGVSCVATVAILYLSRM